MVDLRADIANFLVEVLTTILGFFKGTDVELSEEMVTSIEKFVNLIFML